MKRILYVGGVNDEISEDVLHGAFIPFGEVSDIKRITNTKGGSRGFAFVEMELPEDAKHAMDNMHLSEINGRVITVNFATKSHIALIDVRHQRQYLNEKKFNSDGTKEEDIEDGDVIESLDQIDKILEDKERSDSLRRYGANENRNTKRNKDVSTSEGNKKTKEPKNKKMKK